MELGRNAKLEVLPTPVDSICWVLGIFPSKTFLVNLNAFLTSYPAVFIYPLKFEKELLFFKKKQMKKLSSFTTKKKPD